MVENLFRIMVENLFRIMVENLSRIMVENLSRIMVENLSRIMVENLSRIMVENLFRIMVENLFSIINTNISSGRVVLYRNGRDRCRRTDRGRMQSLRPERLAEWGEELQVRDSIRKWRKVQYDPNWYTCIGAKCANQDTDMKKIRILATDSLIWETLLCTFVPFVGTLQLRKRGSISDPYRPVAGAAPLHDSLPSGRPLSCCLSLPLHPHYHYTEDKENVQ